MTQWKTALRLTARIRSTLAGVSSAKERSRRLAPALLTRMSMRPSSERIQSAMAWTAVASVTSAGLGWAVPPARAMSAATRSSSSGRRPVRMRWGALGGERVGGGFADAAAGAGDPGGFAGQVGHRGRPWGGERGKARRGRGPRPAGAGGTRPRYIGLAQVDATLARVRAERWTSIRVTVAPLFRVRVVLPLVSVAPARVWAAAPWPKSKKVRRLVATAPEVLDGEVGGGAGVFGEEVEIVGVAAGAADDGAVAVAADEGVAAGAADQGRVA